jgi:hypothetical protein
MKKIIFSLFIVLVILTPLALACGERDVKLVDSVVDEPTVTKKSACSKEKVQVNKDEVVLVEEKRIEVNQHDAQHILEEYLQNQYADKVAIVTDDHSDVPGHEEHHHVGGNLQDSHGTISYAFLVRGGADFYEGKAIPLYVDAENGDVYGVGCGFGAGKVVYSPEKPSRHHSILKEMWEWITVN